jgi:hypothetical protein
MRRQPETAGAAFVRLGVGLLVNFSVHRAEPIRSRMADIHLAGTGFQRFTSTGAVACQLPY